MFNLLRFKIDLNIDTVSTLLYLSDHIMLILVFLDFNTLYIYSYMQLKTIIV